MTDSRTTYLLVMVTTDFETVTTVASNGRSTHQIKTLICDLLSVTDSRTTYLLVMATTDFETVTTVASNGRSTRQIKTLICDLLSVTNSLIAAVRYLTVWMTSPSCESRQLQCSCETLSLELFLYQNALVSTCLLYKLKPVSKLSDVRTHTMHCKKIKC